MRTYADDTDGENVWNRRELFQRYQHGRERDIAVADMLFELARCLVKHRPHRTPQACGMCVRASALYQAAGLTRRGRLVWRWARFAHRARWREATR